MVEKVKTTRRRKPGADVLMTAFDTLSSGVMLVVPTGDKRTIRFVSRALGSILGVLADALVGKEESVFWEILLARLGNPSTVREDLERIWDNPNEIRTDILHLVEPYPLVLERSTTPLVRKDGTVFGRIWTFRNASREFKLKDEQQRKRKTEYCFRSLSSFLFEASLSSESMVDICRIGCLGMDVVSAVFVPLVEERQEVAQFSVSRRFQLHPPWERLRDFVSRALPRLDAASTLVLEVDSMVEEVQDLFVTRGIDRIMFVPVGYGTTIFGVMFFEELNQERDWARDDFRCVESIARAMGLWLHKERGERRLIEAREEAEAAVRVRSDFIALLSHELRTPLNPLIGFTQLLDEQREQLPEEVRDMVSRITEGAMRLRELVEDLLTLTRLDSRLDGWRKYHCDPKGIVEDSCAWARRQPCESTVDVVAEIRTDLGVVEADGAALRRALNALLSNALRFSPDGGKVRAIADIDGDQLHLQIVDRGPGVADAAKRRIFEPFVQGEPVLTRRHGGAGIGLTLVRKVADSHHGRAWVEDGPDGGSIFHLSIPRTVPDQNNED
jgi:signal transduction histidine kinase